MFFNKYAIKPTTHSVARDLLSVIDVLQNSDKEFTADELKRIEDYVAERAKHLKQLRKQAS